jgi:hypothetical protein
MTPVRQFEVIPRLSEGLGKTWTAGSSQTANGNFAPQAVIPYPRNMRIEPPYYSHHDAGWARLRFVGNNSLEAPLNVSTHVEHSSASPENSDGIDPDYCCRSVVVRWRRILGSASRPLVKLTMIDFPNHSRFYDVTRHAVRFWGYDSAIEASFFIDEDALAQIQPGVRPDESGFLNAFDANRNKICAAAARVYVRGSRRSYDLGASNF